MDQWRLDSYVVSPEKSVDGPKEVDNEDGKGIKGRDRERKISVANKTFPLRLTLNAALTSRAGKLFRKRGRFTRPAAASEL